jgi:hypothetical protein
LFQSDTVVRSTIDRLGSDQSPGEFLEDSAELIPLPDAPGLLVIGKGDTFDEAAEVSAAAADALTDALNDQIGQEDFIVFSGPQGTSLGRGLDPSVALAMGAAAGMWLGLAAAIAHYRGTRPVLTLGRALTVTGATSAAIIEGGRSWLGFLRPSMRRRSRRQRHDRDAARSESDPFVIVAYPGSREEDLVAARRTRVDGTGNGSQRSALELLWMR